MYTGGKLRTLIASALIALGGNGLGKIFEAPVRPVFVVVGAILLVGGVGLQFHTVSRYRRFRTANLRKTPAERREVLVLFLSAIRGQPVPAFVQITGELDADLRTLAERKREQSLSGQKLDFWSWEQPLRAIQHNRRDGGPLRRVILLGSADSVQQFPAFVDGVCRKYRDLRQHVTFEAFYKTTRRIKVLDDPVHPVVPDNGFDFEDFDEMTIALGEVIEQLRNDKKNPMPAERIQIDFTGGQKPTSVVAAVTTLFSRLSNIYVATNPRDVAGNAWEYDVWGYDFREERVPDD